MWNSEGRFNRTIHTVWMFDKKNWFEQYLCNTVSCCSDTFEQPSGEFFSRTLPRFHQLGLVLLGEERLTYHSTNCVPQADTSVVAGTKKGIFYITQIFLLGSALLIKRLFSDSAVLFQAFCHCFNVDEKFNFGASDKSSLSSILT